MPIKPICTALSINVQAQQDKIKAHPIYSSVTRLSRVTGADGKQYEMLCMELEFIYGWILSINPTNVGTDSKNDIINYQLQCHHILYRHFFLRSEKQMEANKAEIATLEEINRCLTAEKESRARRKEAEKRLSNIRSARLDDSPSLFD